MLRQSSGSVEVFWLDRDAVSPALGRAVRRLSRVRPEIRRVVLFGSLARGDAVPGSDADLLIVLSASDLPFVERIPRYTLSGVPVGVDVFPYTEKELADMVAAGHGFATRALSEGILIYRSTKARRHNQSPPHG